MAMMFSTRWPLPLLLALSPLAHGLLLPNGTGKLPALGWNSWNAYACNVSEDKIIAAANLVVSLGLKDAGYEYINIDDCWSVKSGRDNVTGKIIPDPVTFPNGISGTADQIHALGLKVGIYSSAGTLTCGGYPASIGNEGLDAATFADWGIDYLKYDNCYVPANWTDSYLACVPDQGKLYGPFVNGTCQPSNVSAPAGFDWSTSNTTKRYNKMRDALGAQNRTILYSLCEWGNADVEEWGNATGNSWRITGDITADWPRVAEILNEASFVSHATDFWGHNDADMLEIGNGDLTLAEQRSHFAFWAGVKSPLIIGTDLSVLSAEGVAILKNEALLAFHQSEVVGAPAQPYKWGVNPDWTFNATNPAEYWSGAYGDGRVLVLALNTANGTETKNVVWAEVPELKGNATVSRRRGAAGAAGAARERRAELAFEVSDVWTGESLGCLAGGVERDVESHDTLGLVVGASC